MRVSVCVREREREREREMYLVDYSRLVRRAWREGGLGRGS